MVVSTLLHVLLFKGYIPFCFFVNAGIVFDDNASIDDTLKHVDVMITDFSSVIINAFLCGIIIIYTGKETTLTPIDTFRKIMDTGGKKKGDKNKPTEEMNVFRGRLKVERACRGS